MKRPVAWGGLAFALGIFLGQQLLSPTFSVVFLVLYALCCVMALILAWKYKVNRKSVAVLLLVLAVGVGWRWCFHRLWTLPALELVGHQPSATMLVVEYPAKTQYGYLVPVSMEGVSTALYLNEGLAVGPGDRIIGRVNVTASNSKSYTLNASQAGVFTVEHAASVPLRFQPMRFRHLLLGQLDKLFGEKSALPKALLTGDRTDFTESFQSALSISGLAHTVAVSGLHLSFLTGIIIFLFGGSKRSAFIAIPLLWLFVAVVGFPASAVRAAIMNTLVLLTPVLRRDYDAFTALGLALGLLVALRPASVAEPGLQLSFASTLGILLFAGRWQRAIQEKWRHQRRLVRTLLGTLTTTGAAMLFTTPLVAVYFGTVSLVAPLTNLLMLPVISVLFVGTLLTCLLSVIPAVGMVLAWILQWGFALLENCITLTAKIPYGALSTQNVPAVLFIVYLYLLLILCAVAWRRGTFRWVLPTCAAVCSLCLVILGNTLFYDRANILEFTAVNVGQGQSVVVSTKNRTTVIDCGGYQAGVATAELLMSQGRGNIDTLILSHYHADHVNGVLTLLERMHVNTLLVPDSSFDGSEEKRFRTQIESLCYEKGTTILYADQDMLVQLGDCRLSVLSPRDSGSVNERCLAVVGQYGDFTFLTTGDMNADSEEKLLLNLPTIDLYMAGHHGSKYSTGDQLLAQITPQATVISVGVNNYGHPAIETLTRLSNSHIYRTDTAGNITVTVRTQKTIE